MNFALNLITNRKDRKIYEEKVPTICIVQSMNLTSLLHTSFVANWIISVQLVFSMIFGPAAIPSVWQRNSIFVVHCLPSAPQTDPDLYKRNGESLFSSDNWSPLLTVPIDDDWPPVTLQAPTFSAHCGFASAHMPNTYFSPSCSTVYGLPDSSFKSYLKWCI